MARRVVRTERVDQPQGFAGVNWGNPITRDLEFAWLPHVPGLDAAKGRRASSFASGGAPLQGSNPAGVGGRGGSNRAARWNGSLLRATADYTALVAFVDDAGRGAVRNPFDADNATLGNRVFQLRLDAGNTPRAIVFGSGGNVQPAGASVVSSTGVQILALRVLAGTATLWHNGLQVASGAVPGTVNSFSLSNTVLSVGAMADTSVYSQGFGGLVLTAQYFARGLAAIEIASLSANPWQLFEPQARSVNLAAATGDVTLALRGLSATADRGALVAALDKAAAGLAVTASRGTLSPETAKALTGSSISAQLGTLAAALSVGLTGLQSSVLGGTVTAQIAGDVTVALTGLSASVAAGVTVPAIQITASGQGVSAAAGALAHSRTIALLGAQSAAQGGTLSATGGTVVAKIKGLRKTRYTPGRVPAELAQLAQFLQSEIERITDGLESPFTHQLLEQLTVEPSRKPTAQALIAYADGTNWNPGSGEGVYAYYSGSWHLLG